MGSLGEEGPRLGEDFCCCRDTSEWTEAISSVSLGVVTSFGCSGYYVVVVGGVCYYCWGSWTLAGPFYLLRRDLFFFFFFLGSSGCCSSCAAFVVIGVGSSGLSSIFCVGGGSSMAGFYMTFYSSRYSLKWGSFLSLSRMASIVSWSLSLSDSTFAFNEYLPRVGSSVGGI